MESRLMIRNFGPIEFVDLDLRNVNVFIGPQATGKSSIAKLFTIFKAPRKFLRNGNTNHAFSKQSFLSALDEYNIASFLKPDSEIQFESSLHDLRYVNQKLEYSPKLIVRLNELKLLGENYENNFNEIGILIMEVCKTFNNLKAKIEQLLATKEENDELAILENIGNFITLSKENFLKILEISYSMEEYLSTSTSIYIPAERSFINIIKNASLNLQLNNVPIPKNILAFGAELEKSGINKIELDFLQQGLTYKNVNNEDRVFFNETSSIKLSESASGIQSVLPILISLKQRRESNRYSHRSFVIEEPELNLFPLAQYDLIKHLESNRVDSNSEDWGTFHTYTTHSPYILSALNNLLLGSLVHKKIFPSRLLPVEDFVKSINLQREIRYITGVLLDPDKFTAYQIKEGKAESIFNRETGLIDNNFIDESSDKISDDFDELMALLK